MQLTLGSSEGGGVGRLDGTGAGGPEVPEAGKLARRFRGRGKKLGGEWVRRKGG